MFNNRGSASHSDFSWIFWKFSPIGVVLLWHVHILRFYVQYQVLLILDAWFFFCLLFCNFYLLSDYFRAMLLKPSYETPYDTTEQILKSGIIPINSNGTVFCMIKFEC